MLIAQTLRLRLRELTLADLPALNALFGDARTLAHWRITLSPAEVRAMVDRALASYAAHGMGQWASELAATGQLVGTAGMRPTATPGELELLWHLRREHWGKGYATEAAKKLVELARAKGATRIIAPILPGNAPSSRVAQRLGMRLEPAQVEVHGQLHDLWAL